MGWHSYCGFDVIYKLNVRSGHIHPFHSVIGACYNFMLLSYRCVGDGAIEYIYIHRVDEL